MHDTVKLQIFVRYLFSYFRLETGSYVLIFVLSRVCEENDVEIQWLQSKKKFSYDIKFRTFSKVRNVRKYIPYENLWLYSIGARNAIENFCEVDQALEMLRVPLVTILAREMRLKVFWSRPTFGDVASAARHDIGARNAIEIFSSRPSFGDVASATSHDTGARNAIESFLKSTSVWRCSECR